MIYIPNVCVLLWSLYGVKFISFTISTQTDKELRSVPHTRVGLRKLHAVLLLNILYCKYKWFFGLLYPVVFVCFFRINIYWVVPRAFKTCLSLPRGDHTSCNLWVAVVPPGTQMVVFSIDGALTASVSVSGKDPKVRPGAVDVLRIWQQKGYLLLYVTGRPDLQRHKVGGGGGGGRGQPAQQ